MTSQGTREHWCRVVMNRETRRLLSRFDIPSMNALEISGNAWRHLPFKFYFPTSYPSYDVCNSIVTTNRPDYPSKFDIVIAEQVFEHLPYPGRAVQNIHYMLNPGGYFLVTTPFFIKLHGSPEDYTRWSETGLRYLLHENGFPMETIETGSWGNRDCIAANFDEWVEYDPEKHSLENEPDLPMVVWALARK